MKSKKTDQAQITGPDKHLANGATILMESFKTPAAFLDFLSESIYWFGVYQHDKAKGTADQAYPIKQMISEIVLPWLKDEPNAARQIKEGLKQIHSNMFYEGYYEFLSYLMHGFAMYMSDGPLGKDEMKAYLSAFNTMYEIGYCIEAYEEDKDKERDQSKLPKAA